MEGNEPQPLIHNLHELLFKGPDGMVRTFSFYIENVAYQRNTA